MDEKKKHLAFAILEFLQLCIDDKTIVGDAAESMDVAKQCISEAFHVDPTRAEDQKKYATKPATLSSIFDVYLQASNKKSSASIPTPAAPSATPSNSADREAKADAFKARGNEMLKANKHAEAIDLYTQAIDLHPLNPVYFCNRAAAYTHTKAYEEAVDDCEMALSIDPAHVKAYSRMAVAQLAMGDTSGCIRSCKRGLELDAGNDSLSKTLREAESKAGSGGDRGVTSPASGGNGMGGMPDLSALAGLAGGAGAGGNGGFDLASLMSNPAIMNMAQQVMSNPQMAGMLGNMMGGGGASGSSSSAGGAGGANPLADMMNNPDIMNMAQQFAAGNPAMADMLKKQQESAKKK